MFDWIVLKVCKNHCPPAVYRPHFLTINSGWAAKTLKSINSGWALATAHQLFLVYYTDEPPLTPSIVNGFL